MARHNAVPKWPRSEGTRTKLIYSPDDRDAAILATGTAVPSDTTAGYAPGCVFIHNDGSSGDAFYVNNGTATSCDFDAAATSGTTGAADVGIADAGAFTATATVEAALQELYQHLFSTTGGSIPINIGTLREVDANGDVGAIAVASGNGGNLASDTTPILRSDANEAFELFWAAGNADIVSLGMGVPADFDGTADCTIKLFVKSAGTTDLASFTVNTSWDGATQVADTATGQAVTTLHTATATVAAADIPNAPSTLTIQLVPAAHATDGIHLLGARVDYKRKLLTS